MDTVDKIVTFSLPTNGTMKATYSEFQKKSSEELKAIWENALICFDTNVLLNLYRYSKDTRDEILELMEKLKDKIYLPHQVGLEFNKNRF
ncbi:MAG: DUF4935 domain-containing protein [Crocinitomicaceae bacterium]|nr:DUF4935 domain-containing protein [Crocinitomicaceae bacterium]